MPFSAPLEDSRYFIRIGQSENFSVFWKKKNPGIFWPVSWSVVKDLKSKSSLFPEKRRSAGGCCGASPGSVLPRTGTPEQGAGSAGIVLGPETCQVQFSCLTLILKQLQAVPVVTTWQSLAFRGTLFPAELSACCRSARARASRCWPARASAAACFTWSVSA